MKLDAAAVLAFVGYSAFWWWPTRNLPYHWDTALFVVCAARDLLATGFHPLVVSHTDFAHPPLFMALLALAWRAFGETRLVAHALVFPILPLAMSGVYFLGRTLSDRVTGAVSALLFGGLPVVLEEYGQVYMDLPAGTVIAWALVAWFAGRPWIAGVLFALAAMLKLPTLVVPATLGLFVLADAESRSDARRWLSLACAPVVTAVWLTYHHAVTGWWLVQPHRTTHESRSLDRFISNFAIAEWRVLLAEWRIVLVAGALVAWLVARRRGTLAGGAARPLLPLLAMVMVGCCFFAVFGEIMERYTIFILAPYVVWCVAVLRMATHASAVPTPTIGALAFLLFTTTWRGSLPRSSVPEFDPDQNLAYLDMIRIGLQSSRYVELNHGTAEIYGSVPEWYELTAPYEGYVTRPLDFATCDRFVLHPDKEQLVFRHEYAAPQKDCAKIVADTGARLEQRFTSHDKWVELYLVPSSVHGG